MEPTDRKDLFIPGYVSRARPDGLTKALVAAQVVIGVAIAVIAGPIFGRAVTLHSLMYWILGGVCLVTGVLLTAAGLTSSKRRMQALLRPATPETAAEEQRKPAMPMLGAILVYRHRVITEGQLQQALDRQRAEQRKGRRVLIGDLLVEMGLATPSQVSKALEEQQAQIRIR